MPNFCFHRIRVAGRRILALGLFVLPSVTLLFLVPATGQQLPLSPDQILQMQQRMNGGSAQGSNGVNTAPEMPMVFQPAVPPQMSNLRPSRLEQIMSARAGVDLQQFGYDQLGRASAVVVPQTGAIQDDYVLGPDDEILLVLRGQENSEYRASVNRNGQVILPRLSPIPATGRTLGSFRQDIQSAVQRSFVATQASVTVTRMRQISVLVTGAVNNPGQRLLTGLSSALDALMLSGGIAKSGSLRDVRIIRGGRQYPVDLYGVISGSGSASGVRLTDGDRIFVPPLGRTVAVSGLVRSPGIYELAPRDKSISAQALIALAGGPEVNGNYLYSLLRLQPDGRTALVQLSSTNEPVMDGEILTLQFQADQMAARVLLSGGTGLAGSYPLASGTKLSDLIRRPGALGASPYTLMGLIARRDPQTLLRTLVAFTPVAVLRGVEDIPLQADDIIRVLSVDEMHMAMTAVRDFDDARSEREEALHNPGAVANVGNLPDNAVQEQNTVQSVVNRAPPRISVSGQSGATVVGTNNPGTSLSGATVVAANNAGQNNAGQNNAGQNNAGQNNAGQYNAGQNNSGQNFQGTNNNASNFAGAPGFSGAMSAAGAVPAPNFQNQTTAPGIAQSNREVNTFAQLSQQLNVDPLVLANFLLDRMVTIDGAVRGPGSYFGGPNTTLQDIVMAAGGTMNWADTSGVELISTTVEPSSGRSVSRVVRLPLSNATLANYVVRPRDVFRFNQVFTDVDAGNATVQGEVRFTGNYKLTRGERLSDLLSRAGGLTNSAYPYGTVFLRKSAAAKEQESYVNAARELNNQLMVAMTRVGTNKLDPTAFVAMQTFVADLRNQKALGRIAVVADPSVLATNTAMDPLLESGDVIYIPPRPSTISVLGEVTAPGNFPYVAGTPVSTYIERAGGYKSLADKGETYVVFPDGTGRKLETSWLRFGEATSLPPGSAIVVPRDIMPFDLRQTIIDVSQIFSQLAVSIASVAVISKQ